MSLTLLAAALGVPRLFPDVSPRLVARVGVLLILLGLLVLLAGIDVDAGAEIVTVSLLLAGLGLGALASQLGAVTVSAVPDEQSSEVGGLQNTVTNLGASLGTALAGSVLVAVLTASFLTHIEMNKAIPQSVKNKANVELAAGIPFMSDKQLQAATKQAGSSSEVTSAALDANALAWAVSGCSRQLGA
jgi:MFS family permease